ncbi:hypothetical protein L1276_001093 [Flavobacterium sp. HSC-32F16]|nr:hypothetical protein [Flavobacterium sp. HSC-32F16]
MFLPFQTDYYTLAFFIKIIILLQIKRLFLTYKYGIYKQNQLFNIYKNVVFLKSLLSNKKIDHKKNSIRVRMEF